MLNIIEIVIFVANLGFVESNIACPDESLALREPDEVYVAVEAFCPHKETFLGSGIHFSAFVWGFVALQVDVGHASEGSKVAYRGQ